MSSKLYCDVCNKEIKVDRSTTKIQRVAALPRPDHLPLTVCVTITFTANATGQSLPEDLCYDCAWKAVDMIDMRQPQVDVPQV